MNNPEVYGLGLLGLAIASASMNPLLWATLLLTLWRKWSLGRAAGFAAAAAAIWGFFMHSIQSRIAPEVMATDEEWILRVVVMVVFSMIWMTLTTYIVRLLWNWCKTTVAHVSSRGRAAYDQVRRNAPAIIEEAKTKYRANIGSNVETEADDDAFEIAGKELRINRPIESLWARALMLAEGDQEKARSKYIKLRVEQITKLRQTTNS